MAVPARTRMRDWLLETAEAARQTALRALRSSNPGRVVRMGASGSPTSALDQVTEQVLIRALDDAPVPLNLLSEEIGIVDRGSDWWLVADPVDGTRNALHGIPIFAVSLAVGRRDLSGIEMGIVHSIPTDGTYWAEKGRGATYEGRRLRVRRRHGKEILVGAALDYEEGLRLPRKAAGVHFRDLGSAALEMCFVAQGRLDGFLCSQPIVRIIDVAASTLVVREAGGRVLDLSGRPLNAPFAAAHRFPMAAVTHKGVWEMLR